MKRFIVCGGREYTDWIAVFYHLNRISEKFAAYKVEGDQRVRTPGIAAIIQGGECGADEMAREWAGVFEISCTTFHADYKRDGDRAGPINNQRMIAEAEADGVIAFPGGRRTADLIARARAAGLNVWEPEKVSK